VWSRPSTTCMIVTIYHDDIRVPVNGTKMVQYFITLMPPLHVNITEPLWCTPRDQGLSNPTLIKCMRRWHYGLKVVNVTNKQTNKQTK
jgi:hypothetical protein